MSTGGLGTVGGGQMRLRVRGAQDQLEINYQMPAMVVFSSHFKWLDLKGLISRMRSLPRQHRQSLIVDYQALLKSQRPKLKQLITFNEKLTRHQLVAPQDSSKPSLQELVLSKRIKHGDRFNPSIGLYRTMLHEVGHQFGLGHPRVPTSVMAYGKHYLHLTTNDRLGMKRAADKVRWFFNHPRDVFLTH